MQEKVDAMYRHLTWKFVTGIKRLKVLGQSLWCFAVCGILCIYIGPCSTHEEIPVLWSRQKEIVVGMVLVQLLGNCVVTVWGMLQKWGTDCCFDAAHDNRQLFWYFCGGICTWEELMPLSPRQIASGAWSQFIIFVAYLRDLAFSAGVRHCCCNTLDMFGGVWSKKNKVVQIWPGQTVTCLHTNDPGHIWTTL